MGKIFLTKIVWSEWGQITIRLIFEKMDFQSHIKVTIFLNEIEIDFFLEYDSFTLFYYTYKNIKLELSKINSLLKILYFILTHFMT